MLRYDADISAEIADRQSNVAVVVEEAASHLESRPCPSATETLEIKIKQDWSVSSVSSPPDEIYQSHRLTLTQDRGDGKGQSRNHNLHTFFDSAALLAEARHSSVLVLGRRGTPTSKISSGHIVIMIWLLLRVLERFRIFQPQ